MKPKLKNAIIRLLGKSNGRALVEIIEEIQKRLTVPDVSGVVVSDVSSHEELESRIAALEARFEDDTDDDETGGETEAGETGAES